MKFSGKVGYAIQVETAPDIWQEKIVERKYLGDVVQTAWHSQAAASTLNDNPSLNCQIEIVADAFAWANYGNIRYVIYENSKWKVSSIQIRRPRLIINFGSIYNDQSLEVIDYAEYAELNRRQTGSTETGTLNETP
jgi:hypothetical protein